MAMVALEAILAAIRLPKPATWLALPRTMVTILGTLVPKQTSGGDCPRRYVESLVAAPSSVFFTVFTTSSSVEHCIIICCDFGVMAGLIGIVPNLYVTSTADLCNQHNNA